MINYNNKVVSALKTVLPTYYEMALTSKTKTPCISYMETNNYSITESQLDTATIGYSYITYQVKVWGNDIEKLQEYSIKIDRALKDIGFKRVSSGELYDNNSTMIQKILTYTALAVEEF